MNIEVIKKIINDKFGEIEEKVNTLNDTLSEKNKKEIDRDVIGYITLFFDGEGSIRIIKQNLSLQTQLTNTNLGVLIRIKSVFRGTINVQYESSEKHKKSWVWYISNRDDIKLFLETILPYSTVKKSQIKLGLEFLEKTTDIKYKQGGMSSEERKYRELMYLKLREAKHYIYTQQKLDNIQILIDNTKQTTRELSSFDWSSAAGFFDAEGTVDAPIDKRDNNIYLRIQIGNTYPYVLIGFKAAFGGNVNIQPKSKNPKHRQKWIWHIGTKDDVKFFLTKIYPYSIVKRPQIELGLKFLETNNYQTKLLISDKLKKMKDEEYTNEEIKILNEQIKEMNVDKLQKTMMDF